MKKFQLNEIEIKTPGVQIRNRIREEYGSIKAFADEIGLYESSIKQYLFSKGLGSSTFKIRVVNAFKKDFHELYLSEEEQVRHMTSTVSWYIYLYNQSKDIKILERLKNLCLEKKLYEDYAIVCRCYAHYYINQGKDDRAYAYMEVAVNSMRVRENIDRFGLYLSELILMSTNQKKKSVLDRLLKEFNQIIDKIEGPLTKGHMYNNLGLAFSLKGEYRKSKYYFNKVFRYHRDSRSKALVYTHIGDLEKLVGSNEKALLNYQKSEKLLSEDDDTIRYVYDEYALYYYENGDFNRAEKYTDKIFQDKSWQISSSDHKFILGFSTIKLYLGKERELVDIVRRLLNEISSEYIYTVGHLYLIDNIVMENHNNEKLLDMLKKVIVDYYSSHNLEEDYRNVLKRILGSISISKSL